MTILYPHGDERLICVTACLDETAYCECGRPLLTPRPVGAFTGALDLDYVVCSGCHAHVVVRVEAPDG